MPLNLRHLVLPILRLFAAIVLASVLPGALVARTEEAATCVGNTGNYCQAQGYNGQNKKCNSGSCKTCCAATPSYVCTNYGQVADGYRDDAGLECSPA
jgi:uncharacterized membrane protein